MSKLFALALAVLSAAALLTSCDAWSGIDIDGSDSQASELVGPSWHLVTARDADGSRVEIDTSLDYIISFEPDFTIGGVAVCNGIGGRYLADDGGAFEIELFYVTEMGCIAHTHDALFLEGLYEAREYEVAQDRLHLGFGRGGVLTFRRADQGRGRTR